MTEERQAFSFGMPFTEKTNMSEETPSVPPESNTNTDIDAMQIGEILTLTCSEEESSSIFEKTRGQRQAGILRVQYDVNSGTLVVKKKK